jgi:NAD(P)-dependent dehydrogenase (short-subunit alcohol dehydrogenase family)
VLSYCLGCAGGIGYETARVLIAVGAGTVIITCRSQKQSEEIRSRLIALPEADKRTTVIAEYADLSSLASTAALADRVLARKIPLHCVILNAGVMACPLMRTADGYELQFGVNHLAQFALVQRLQGALKNAATAGAPARVVTVSSLAHFAFGEKYGISFDDLHGAVRYSPAGRYGESKLANVLFAKEVTRRWGADGVIGVALHPGSIIGTDLKRHASVSVLIDMAKMLLCTGYWGNLRAAVFDGMKSLQQGAATSVFCALNPHITPGGYYSNCTEEHRYVHPLANNAEIAAKLWTVSEVLVSRALSKSTDASERS